jgi:hypothetical protein
MGFLLGPVGSGGDIAIGHAASLRSQSTAPGVAPGCGRRDRRRRLGQEDQHLYHSKGWGRELWIDALGMPAVLPPPEEVKHVETAMGAARAEQNRDARLKKRH